MFSSSNRKLSAVTMQELVQANNFRNNQTSIIGYLCSENVLNSPQQRRQQNKLVAYNSIDVYLFLDVIDYAIRTSVSVNVSQLRAQGVTIRTIFVLRIVSGFSYSYCIHHIKSLTDKSPAIFDQNTLFYVINQLRRSKTLSDTLHNGYLEHLLKLTFTFLIY